MDRTVSPPHEESRGLYKMRAHRQEVVMRNKGVRILISSFCTISKTVIDWCQKPRATRGSDVKRCQLWTVLCRPGGRCKCSEYYERITTEDFALVWVADHHFIRPRNSL